MGIKIRCWAQNCGVFNWNLEAGKRLGDHYGNFPGIEAHGQQLPFYRPQCPNGHYNWIEWSEELHRQHMREDPNYEYQGKR